MSFNLTAPTPPAVRAPVFPHAFLVTEGVKAAIQNAVASKDWVQREDLRLKLPYRSPRFVMTLSADCKKSRVETFCLAVITFATVGVRGRLVS